MNGRQLWTANGVMVDVAAITAFVLAWAASGYGLVRLTPVLATAASAAVRPPLGRLGAFATGTSGDDPGLTRAVTAPLVVLVAVLATPDPLDPTQYVAWQVGVGAGLSLAVLGGFVWLPESWAIRFLAGARKAGPSLRRTAMTPANRAPVVGSVVVASMLVVSAPYLGVAAACLLAGKASFERHVHHLVSPQSLTESADFPASR